MRAWVLGNGPSLAKTNLDLLVDEVTFGVNRVHLIYPQTKMRVKFYVRAEEAFGMEVEDWLDDFLAQVEVPETQIYCNQYFTKHIERHFNNTDIRARVHRIKTCPHYLMHFDNKDCPHTWHQGLCTFGSSVNVAVQLAVQMGYSPIYLVGCDLGYRDETPSHFAEGYEMGDIQPARYANSDTLAAHMIASRSSPVPILNATIGGVLEAYPRVRYEELF